MNQNDVDVPAAAPITLPPIGVIIPKLGDGN